MPASRWPRPRCQQRWPGQIWRWYRIRGVRCQDATTVGADLVIDASGRGSRLPHWLTELGIPLGEPLTPVDARVGYVCRTYRRVGEQPLETDVIAMGSRGAGRPDC